MGRSKNLIKNSCAKDGLDFWEIVAAGGDGFTCCESPGGCKPIHENTSIQENLPCWGTSFGLCLKVQVVDLVEVGFKPALLASKKPCIEIRDWYAPRLDCGCEYQISVRLLGDDKKTEIDKWEFSDRKDAGADWQEAKHDFENYSSGVRYIELTHGGKDTKFWAGHYGVRMTNTGIFVQIPVKAGDSLGMNLLDNPSAKDGLNGWNVLSNGGDGFISEGRPAGVSSNAVIDNSPCWGTSYALCTKQQVVDLAAKGIDAVLIDKKRPKIIVRDWYASRSDCGCEYQISVRLLGEDQNTELEKWEIVCRRDEGVGWMKAQHVFKRYPAGVRYVEFTHGGKDTKFWGGHYGVQMTKSAVKVGKMKKIKNLIQNPSATEGLDSWEVTQSGGDGWKIEESPLGCEPIAKDSCWSTSFQLCEKVQTVYLVEAGHGDEQIDRKRPDITVIDWYGPRFDCGCDYNITVRLLGENNKTELEAWTFSDRREAGADWKETRHVFKNYPKGVRFVEFKHGGNDTRFWAGNYGTKLTRSGIYVGNAPRGKKRVILKNLVKNPAAKDGINGWEVTASGGSGFAVENEAVGCKPISEFNSDAKGNSCWVTSHDDCNKNQTIDLAAEGYRAAYMDKVQPDIIFSEWYATRSDAGCVYWLKVCLLNSDNEEMDTREFREEKKASGDWFQIKDSFKNYGKGARFVKITHGGRDNCGWAGRYGAKITCSSVSLVVSDGASSSWSEDE